MATLVRQLPVAIPVANTSGSFRDFVKFIRDSFEMAGFVNQYPAGMINTSSVNPPNTTNQSRGYDIFAFGDAFQATHPLFVRVTYRTTNANNIHTVQLDLGDLYYNNSASVSGATDFVLSSNVPFDMTSVIISNTLPAGVPNVPQSQSCMSSGQGGNQLSVCMYPRASGSIANNVRMMFSIERTRDWQGNIVPSGAVVIGRGANQLSQIHYSTTENYKSFAVTNVLGDLPLVLSVAHSNNVIRPSIAPFPNGKNMTEPPMLSVIMAHASESAVNFGDSVNVSSSLNQTAIQFGDVTYNYIRLPSSMGGSFTNNTQPYQQLMIIWE